MTIYNSSHILAHLTSPLISRRSNYHLTILPYLHHYPLTVPPSLPSHRTPIITLSPYPDYSLIFIHTVLNADSPLLHHYHHDIASNRQPNTAGNLKKPRKLDSTMQGLMGEANVKLARGEHLEAIKMCMEVVRQCK